MVNLGGFNRSIYFTVLLTFLFENFLKSGTEKTQVLLFTSFLRWSFMCVYQSWLGLAVSNRDPKSQQLKQDGSLFLFCESSQVGGFVAHSPQDRGAFHLIAPQ